MKTRTLLVIMLLTAFQLTYAQKLKTNYGKVTKDELEMETYSMDEKAEAVILSEKVSVYYRDHPEEFKLYTDHYVKIKILTNDGTSHTNISIPFYTGRNATSKSEKIQNLKATSYNLENGKIVKTELNKKYSSEEKINNYLKQLKFTLPNVKAGTVIEYQYQKISDFWEQIPDIEMQHEIPVCEGYYEAMLPVFFNFNISYKKTFPIEIEESMAYRSFSMNIKNSGGGAGAAAYANSNVDSKGSILYDCRKAVFKTSHMPAIKQISHSWCKEDFKASAGFELKGAGVTEKSYRSYSTTWEDVETLILKDDEFGFWLQLPNPYQAEVQALNLKDISSKKERIKLAVELLKSKLTWDNSYKLTSSDVFKAIKAETGSNAELNFVLLSILKEMGIKSYPVVLRTRSYGRLPMVFPTITKLNTFIVAAEINDKETIYLDASVPMSNIGILPVELMVENARIIKPDGNSTWVDLNQHGNNTMHMHFDGSLNDEGILSGKQTAKMEGRFAAEYRNIYATFSEEGIKEKRSEKLESEITNLQLKGLDTPFEELIETYTLEKKISSTNDRIYFNPMIFYHISSNPFIEEERMIPVDMDFPYTFRITTLITLPDNYEVEELPKTTKLSLGKGNSCTYAIEHKGKSISVNYTFTLTQTLFLKEFYKDLSTFFASVVEKNNENVVLKKTTH